MSPPTTSSAVSSPTGPSSSPLLRLRSILFDLDNTLLDFDRAERAALRAALAGLGVSLSRAALSEYRRINEELWARYRRGELAQPVLAVERFRRLLSFLGVDPRRAAGLGRAYLNELCRRGDRLPGCRQTLARLQGRYGLGVVTNGIDRVQRARLRVARLEPFFQVVVTSEACGFAKPDPRILGVALDLLGVPPAQALYVGDDVGTDGGAAARAGMPFCWMDRGRGTAPGLRPPRRRVRSLLELPDLLPKT